MSQTQRVFITGLGAMSALGSGYASLKNALLAPYPAFSHVPQAWLTMPGAPDAYIAKLPENAEAELSHYENVATDRACALALAAGAQAWKQAYGDDMTHLSSGNRRKYGVYWGIGGGGLNTFETTMMGRLLGEKKLLRPMTVVRIMANASAAQLAIKYKLKGPNQTVANACASSAVAIGEAFHAIRQGKLDLAMVGGSESMLVPGVMAAWGALKVLSTQKNAPTVQQAARPFSSERCGLVMGEGAAAFVIESEAHMLARGAVPLAEIVGYASCCDANSMVHPDQEGQIYAMQQALDDAKLTPDHINNINAHATATESGDIEEAQAIHAIFGQNRQPPIVSATKSMHGHLLGGAAALEAAICVVSLQEKTIAATLGSEPREPACAMISLVDAPLKSDGLNYILSNSFAFGGSNASLIFKATPSA